MAKVLSRGGSHVTGDLQPRHRRIYSTGKQFVGYASLATLFDMHSLMAHDTNAPHLLVPASSFTNANISAFVAQMVGVSNFHLHDAGQYDADNPPMCVCESDCKIEMYLSSAAVVGPGMWVKPATGATNLLNDTVTVEAGRTVDSIGRICAAGDGQPLHGQQVDRVMVAINVDVLPFVVGGP